MERVMTSQTPRWLAGVLVGMATISWTLMATLATVPASAATSSGGPNRVTGVEVVGVEQMSATIVIKTDRPVETYESFSLSNPPRVVVDIPDAVHATRGSWNARGPIKEIRASQYKTRPARVVRVVFDLASKLPYQVLTDPGSFQVLIGEAVAEAGALTTPTLPQAAAQTQATTTAQGWVEGVDYQPKDDHVEMFIRTRGEVTFQVSEVSSPPGLILDVGGALIGAQAAKVLDVREVPGPVRRIRATQHRLEPEGVVRIAADLKGQVSYEALQTPEGISLTLRGVPGPSQSTEQAAQFEEPIPTPEVSPTPQGAAPFGEPPLAPASPLMPPAAQLPPAPEASPGEFVVSDGPARLSMDFKDADINNLLRIIAEVSGQNVVSGQDVKGKVTVRLVDVPWDQALDNILRINGFGYVREGNIIRVAKLSAIRSEAQERAKLIQIEEEAPTEPLRTEILRVSYADPAKMVQNLNRIKSKRGSISVDDRTASLLIQDTDRNIEKMRVLLEELDKATPQVLIESRIVNVNSNYTRQLGVEWGFQRANPSVTPRNDVTISSVAGSVTGASIEAPPTGSGIADGFLSSVPAAFNFPVPGATSALSLLLGRTGQDPFSIGARITALERESKARLLSTPRIVALDNQEAEIRSGTDEPFTTVDSSGRTTIAFKEALLVLKVTPKVTNDNRVSMKVEVKDDSVKERILVAGFGDTPVFNRRQATSSLLVDNGSTFVIGGLRKTSTTITENRVPFLGKIPILGWLFKTRSEDVRPLTEELLIFITPTIIEETRQIRR
ncbi:MAG: type IV pilus secretin PilQ [Candidatus Methylomirabilales bacterium]